MTDTSWGPDARSLVSVVDDDESVRESLPDLLRQFGFAAQAFSSAEAFLASEAVSETRCLILDIAMPGMSGPDLQQELMRRRHEIPIVFITAQRRQDRPPAPARARRSGVPVQAVQRDGPARRTQRGASGEVEHDNGVCRERRSRAVYCDLVVRSPCDRGRYHAGRHVRCLRR